MERYLKFREEYPRFFYRGYDIEETLNELKITYTFEDVYKRQLLDNASVYIFLLDFCNPV